MNDGLDPFALVFGLVGGLAFFLFGMDIMTRALKQVAGDYLKSLLARMTGRPVRGLIAGASITALVQSSSITTVLLVGFISAGLMTTGQSVAVIFGANIGSTVTAQILAFDVSAIALPMLSLGFFVALLTGREPVREYGRFLLGMGLIFFGMMTMSDALTPLRSYQPFVDFMLSLDHPLVAALLGAVFTAVIQSSAATTGILIVMVGQGLIGLQPAIALALGANIGTCATALLASIGARREAVRAAVIHTLFNVAGVAIWIGFVDQLADIARAISPIYPDLEGAARISAEAPRQLANIHTLFNVANALLFAGFTAQFARLAERLVPDRPEPAEPLHAPRHLDPQFLNVPAIALDAVRLEILHLGQLVRDMLAAAVPAVIRGSPLQIDQVRVMDRPVDLLHREIVGFLRQVNVGNLSPEDSSLFMGLAKIANDLEHIGDLVATGMVTSARKRLEEDVVISPATAAVIQLLHSDVLAALEGSLEALQKQDGALATEVRAMKAGFTRRVEEIAGHEVARLRTDEPKRLQTYTREIELTETLDDIFRIVRRTCRTQIAMFGKPGKPSTA